MADLVSTLTITGTINGRTVTYSNIFTVEDIEDAGDIVGTSAQNNVLSGGAAFPGDPPSMDYSAPQFMVFQNTADSDRLQLTMTNNTGPVNAVVHLNPGEMFILNKATDGGGFNNSATATTTTFLDLDNLACATVETTGPEGPYRVFAAYKNPAS